MRVFFDGDVCLRKIKPNANGSGDALIEKGGDRRSCSRLFQVALSEYKRRGIIIEGDMLFRPVGWFEILFLTRPVPTGEQSGQDVKRNAVKQSPKL